MMKDFKCMLIKALAKNLQFDKSSIRTNLPNNSRQNTKSQRVSFFSFQRKGGDSAHTCFTKDRSTYKFTDFKNLADITVT